MEAHSELLGYIGMAEKLVLTTAAAVQQYVTGPDE